MNNLLKILIFNYSAEMDYILYYISVDCDIQYDLGELTKVQSTTKGRSLVVIATEIPEH